MLVLPIQATIRPIFQPELTEIKGNYLVLSWGDLWNKLSRRKVPGGGRGNICAIAPGRLDAMQEIWSKQPLFLWYGKGQQIELFSLENEESVWKQEIKEGQTSIFYDEEPLEPGRSYKWRLSVLHPLPVKSVSYPFRVMEEQERDRISNDLIKLEERLKRERASVEKIALEKASYFAGRELWSDVLREIYSVPDPSAELTEIIEQIPSSNYCQQAEAKN